MASKTYRPGMEAELRRDLLEYPKRLMVEFHREMHAEAGVYALAITPRGDAPKRGTFDKLSERWGDRIGRRDRVPSSPRQNLKAIKLGTKSARINDDAGAAAIDFGRKRNHYKNFSRLGGSAQAPEGISEPTRRHLLGYANTTAAARATAEADRRFGK